MTHRLLTLGTVAALGLAPLAIPTSAHAMAPTSSVCGSGSWALASRTAKSPGTLALYRQKVSTSQTKFCAVFFNASGRRVQMRVELHAKPTPTRSMHLVGLDQGAFSSYAGPLTTTVTKGGTVRAWGWSGGDNTHGDFVEAAA